MDMDTTGSRIEYNSTSAYDFKIASADGTNPDILSDCVGKVTLVFNISGGCGNYPQLVALKALDDRYKDEPDFQLKGIVVDDFNCHGYGAFNDGLEVFAENEESGEYKGLTPGQISEKYAQENYDVEFEFSEGINGRFDKHLYDPQWRPGAQYEQEMHPFWQHLVRCDDLPRDENNLPHHHEASPWSDEPQAIDATKPGFCGLQGNFEKFLIGRNGRYLRRYANGFLLGERNTDGRYFPWWTDAIDPPPIPDWADPKWFNDEGNIHPEMMAHFGIDETGQSVYPNGLQRRGIEESLDMLCADIDDMLAGIIPEDRGPSEIEGNDLDGDGVGRKGWLKQWGPPTRTALEAQQEYGSTFEVGRGVQ
jgi:glutathione peroxidase-family protein